MTTTASTPPSSTIVVAPSVPVAATTVTLMACTCCGKVVKNLNSKSTSSDAQDWTCAVCKIPLQDVGNFIVAGGVPCNHALARQLFTDRAFEAAAEGVGVKGKGKSKGNDEE